MDASEGPLLFLLGAGASVDSGLRTYRGPNGYYSSEMDREGHPMNIDTFHRTPDATWRHLNELLADVPPQRGPTYDKIDAMAYRHPGSMIVTQNVDGLARSCVDAAELVELHGCALEKHCASCRRTVAEAPPCDACGYDVIRPNVVLYGEAPDKKAFRRIFTFIAKRKPRTCYVVGTTLQFGYLHEILDKSRHHGARIVHVNPDPEYKWHERRSDGKRRRKKPDLLLRELGPVSFEWGRMQRDARLHFFAQMALHYINDAPTWRALALTSCELAFACRQCAEAKKDQFRVSISQWIKAHGIRVLDWYAVERQWGNLEAPLVLPNGVFHGEYKTRLGTMTVYSDTRTKMSRLDSEIPLPTWVKTLVFKEMFICFVGTSIVERTVGELVIIENLSNRRVITGYPCKVCPRVHFFATNLFVHRHERIIYSRSCLDTEYHLSLGYNDDLDTYMNRNELCGQAMRILREYVKMNK